ncbi:MAG TPA: hypothetical protein VNU70_05395, partial [Puia sp.]|nr:hypothetical protein [Puia sp.]
MKDLWVLLCLSGAVSVASAQTDSARRRLDSEKLFLQPVEVRALRAGEKAPFTKTDIGKRQIETTNV